MRLNFTNRVLALFFVTLVTLGGVRAQDFTEIFKAPEQDAQTYLNNYVGPGMLSFANGMAGGWYNTAKPHKTLGFDLTFTINMANIPSSERSFLFNNSDYNNLQSIGSNELPTLVGGPTTQQLSLVGSYTDPTTGNTYNYTAETFTAPEGFDVEDLPIAGVPVPMVQLGLGLIKNTDLKLRYGQVNDDENGYSVNLFGLGVMHDFKQWIPGIKHIPIDMSVFFGYSRFKATIDIDENEPSFTANGEGEMKASTTTFQVLVSKKLAILTPYFGVGYNAVSSSFKVNGTFVNNNLTDINGNPFTLVNPVDLTFDGGSSLRTTLGLRIKLAIITLHADYTLQKYNMLTAGLGLSIR